MRTRGSIDHVIHHVRLGDAKREEALEHYQQAGEGLRKLKQLVGHGRFGKVLEKCACTHNFANRLMKLSREWRANGSVD